MADKRESLREEEESQPQHEVTSYGVLDFDISDTDLIRVLDLKESEAFKLTDKIRLTERRKDNNDYWQGKQIDRKMLYNWQVPYVDNVIFRDTETILPIAVSKVPDILVSNPSEDQQKRQRAEKLQQVLDFRVKSHYVRAVLRKMARHVILDFVGIVKCRWDRVKQTFVFDAIRPSNVDLDPTAVPNQFGMSSEAFEYISEWIEEPIKVVIAKFPDKKEEIFRRAEGGPIIRGTERQLASKMRYQEIWFTWYDDDGMPSEAVCWRYKDLLLGKMRNPYWDYEGEQKETGQEDPFTGEPLTQQVFFNHFSRPMKPYIIVNHQSTGASGPFDDTSVVEQAIPLQDVVNKRGRQITELADKANPKKIISNTFMSKDEAAEITDDPQETIVGDGPVGEGFTYVPGIPPNPVLFQDLVQNRLEIDNIIGAHSTTRGERVPEESGIARQITREGDFGRIDDFVFQVIEPAADEIANWMVQFMKVFGTSEQFIQVLGQDGQSEFVEFDRDSIDDGINIMVEASTVDKTERRATATQLASAGSIDPLTLFEDLDAKNPKERARRLALMNADPTGAAYMQYIIGDQQAAGTLTETAAAAAAAKGGGEAPPATTPPPEAPPEGGQIV